MESLIEETQKEKAEPEVIENIRELFTGLAPAYEDIAKVLPDIENDLSGNLTPAIVARMNSFLARTLLRCDERDNEEIPISEMLGLVNDYDYALENDPINTVEKAQIRSLLRVLKRQVRLNEIAEETRELIQKEAKNALMNPATYNIFYLRKLVRGYEATLDGRPVRNIGTEKQKIGKMLEILDNQCRIQVLRLEGQNLIEEDRRDKNLHPALYSMTILGEIADKYMYLVKYTSPGVTNIDKKMARARKFLKILGKKARSKQILLKWAAILEKLPRSFIVRKREPMIEIVSHDRHTGCAECEAREAGVCPGSQT